MGWLCCHHCNHIFPECGRFPRIRGRVVDAHLVGLVGSFIHQEAMSLDTCWRDQQSFFNCVNLGRHPIGPLRGLTDAVVCRQDELNAFSICESPCRSGGDFEEGAGLRVHSNNVESELCRVKILEILQGCHRDLNCRSS